MKCAKQKTCPVFIQAMVRCHSLFMRDKCPDKDRPKKDDEGE